MNRTLKKLVSFLAAGTMIMSLASCGSPAASPGGGENSAGEEDITLTFWNVWPSGDNADLVERFITQYEEEHPNIHIETVSADSTEYKTRKLPVAIAAEEQGDIFYTWGAGYAKPFVESGAVIPLDEYMEADNTSERLLDGVTTYFVYDGKTYGLPLTNWACVLYCNKELFESNNIKYPETFDELLEAVDKFNELGVTPIALGGKSPIFVQFTQNALAVRTAGAENVMAACEGSASFDTPEIAKSVELLIELMDRNAFPKGFLGLDGAEAIMEFHTGNAAMLVTGSWEALTCESENSNMNGNVTALPFPLVEGGAGDATHSSGGAHDCLMISSKTKYPQEAFDFAVAFAEYKSKEACIIGDSLPAWKADFDSIEINPVLRQIMDFTTNVEHYALSWDNTLTGEAIESYMNLLQEALGKTITPEEFAKKMQEVNERVLSES